MTPRPVIPDHLKRESEIQAEIVRCFRAIGLRVWITSEPRAKKSSRNLWDLYLLNPRNGRSAWFETKAPGGTLTPGQRDFRQLHLRSETMFAQGQMTEARELAIRLGALAKVAA